MIALTAYPTENHHVLAEVAGAMVSAGLDNLLIRYLDLLVRSRGDVVETSGV